MAISERVTRSTNTPALIKKNGSLITDPACPQAVRDAYRQTYLNMQFALLGKSGRSILVSAVDAAADAGLLATNLALVSAQEGERVALIDANPYQPCLDTLFSLTSRPGFSTLLRQDSADDVASAVQETEIPGFWLVGAGDSGGYPGGIGRAAALSDIIRRLKSGVDRLIIIGTPILTHVDSMDLAPHVEGVLLTLTPGKTQRQAASRACSLLEHVHAPLLGVVLTL